MSSSITAEELSVNIIRGILKLLNNGGLLSSDQIKNYFEQTPSGHQQIMQRVYYLNRSKLIERTGSKYGLTKKGRQRLDSLHFQPLGSKNSKWDGKWRVLTFDIPEEKRLARDAIRGLIKSLGFRQLHKSVWIQPWPCREEVDRIQEAYDAKSHISLLEVITFDQESVFRRVFQNEIR